MSLVIVIIAISLSMDAFSLALAYGTLNLNKSSIVKISLIVGFYHFFMPLLGMNFGSALLSYLKINPNLVVFLILLFIGIQMIYETFKEENLKSIMSILEMLLFGLAVSIDSFSVGIGLKVISNNIALSAITFSIFSFLFTYFGLKLGKKINNIVGKSSTILGGIVLIIIGIVYLF